MPVVTSSWVIDVWEDLPDELVNGGPAPLSGRHVIVRTRFCVSAGVPGACVRATQQRGCDRRGHMTAGVIRWIEPIRLLAQRPSPLPRSLLKRKLPQRCLRRAAARRGGSTPPAAAFAAAPGGRRSRGRPAAASLPLRRGERRHRRQQPARHRR
eukprot:353474-Chlamydomonas_euryale.AAC.1